jgi:hypothetical protein
MIEVPVTIRFIVLLNRIRTPGAPRKGHAGAQFDADYKCLDFKRLFGGAGEDRTHDLLTASSIPPL